MAKKPAAPSKEKLVGKALDEAVASAAANSDARPLEHVTKGRPKPSRTARPTRATVSNIQVRLDTDDSEEAQRAARQRVATIMGPVASEPAAAPSIPFQARVQAENSNRLSQRLSGAFQPPPPSADDDDADNGGDEPPPPQEDADAPPPPPPPTVDDEAPPPPAAAQRAPVAAARSPAVPQRRGPVPTPARAAAPTPASTPTPTPTPARAAPAMSRVSAREPPARALSSSARVPAAATPPILPRASSSRPGPPEPAPPKVADEPAAPPARPVTPPGMLLDEDEPVERRVSTTASALSLNFSGNDASDDDDNDDVAPPPRPDSDDEDDSVQKNAVPPTPPAPTPAAVAAAVSPPPVSVSPGPPPVGSPQVPPARRTAGSAVQRGSLPMAAAATGSQGAPMRQMSMPESAARRQPLNSSAPGPGLARTVSHAAGHPPTPTPAAGAPAAAAPSAASSADGLSGWLEKKGQKRFFVLRQKSLFWFKDKVDANAPVPELAKQCQKSIVLTASRKVGKNARKPAIMISSEKEKPYELFAATQEEADKWFAALVHALAMPMGASGGGLAAHVQHTDSSPPDSPVAPRNPSPAQQKAAARSGALAAGAAAAVAARPQPLPRTSSRESPASTAPIAAAAAVVAPTVVPAVAAGPGTALTNDNGVDLRAAPWFEVLTSEQAVARLVGKPLGTFCVRVSSNNANLVVTYVQSKDTVLHVAVKKTPQGEWTMDGVDVKFKSMAALLMAYKDTYRTPLATAEKGGGGGGGGGGSAPPPILPSPRNASVSPPDAPDEDAPLPTGDFMDGKHDLRQKHWYHGEMASKEAAEVLQGHPPGSFLVRYSTNNVGGFVISYVTKGDNVLMHLLVKREPQGLMPTAGPKHFADMIELLHHYSPVFDKPVSAAK